MRNGISGSERLLYDPAKESTIMRASPHFSRSAVKCSAQRRRELDERVGGLQSGAKRHAWRGVSNCGWIVKELVAFKAGMQSAADLLKDLGEKTLKRETARHLHPDLSHGHANQSADFQQPQTNGAGLRMRQVSGTQTQTAQAT